MLDAPEVDREALLAVRVWNGLHNGAGAFDWAGLPLMCALYGIADVERLLHDLMTIKAHAAQRAAGTTEET